MACYLASSLGGRKAYSFVLICIQCLYTPAIGDVLDFSYQYFASSNTVLNLKCQTNDKSVTTITIYNITSFTPGQKMAWIDKSDNLPSVDVDLELTTSKHIFVNGDLSMAHDKNARLQLVITDYDFSKDQLFRCDIVISSQGAITSRNSTVLVNTRGSTYQLYSGLVSGLSVLATCIIIVPLSVSVYVRCTQRTANLCKQTAPSPHQLDHIYIEPVDS